MVQPAACCLLPTADLNLNLLCLLLLSIMQQATAPATTRLLQTQTNRQSHGKQKEPFNIQGEDTVLTQDLSGLGMVHFFHSTRFRLRLRVAGEKLTAQGKKHVPRTRTDWENTDIIV